MPLPFAGTKDPQSKLDYTIDWSSWLETADEVVTSSWTADIVAGDLQPISIETQSHTSTSTRVWVSGGTSGKIYKLVNTIVTLQNRIDQRTVRLKIEHH